MLVQTAPLACSGGPSPSTRQVPGSSPGSGGRAARAFFLHPPFLPPSGDSFFRTFPTNPAKVLGLCCSDPECTRNRIITEIGDLLAVDTSSCSPCTLAVNTTKQNRIRLDISNIYSWSRSYIVHDGVGTSFTEDLTSCSITLPSNALEIYIGGYTKFRISAEATIQDSLDSATNTPIVTDCAGLAHFDVKEPDVIVDLICADSPLRCTRNRIITEIGDLLAVDMLLCRSCRLTANTTKQNRLRLDINAIYLSSLSYIVHDGVGTRFTEDLNSCFIIFPTNELEILMDGFASFRISTESATNDTIVTDCVGLVQFNAELIVDFDLVCSNSWCTKNSIIITDIGDLLTVNTLHCGLCTLTVNTQQHNRIHLDIISLPSKFSVIHNGVGTQVTGNPGKCFITFPTNELDIYFVGAMHLMISAKASNQVSSQWNTTIYSDCVGVDHYDNVEEVKYTVIQPYIESNYKEIQRYVTSLYSRELKGILPACPFNCTCSLDYQHLIAHCNNKLEKILLFHKFTPNNLLPNTLDASERKLESMDRRAFKDLSYINRLILNKNFLTHIESETFTSTPLRILEIADNMITELEVGVSYFHVLNILDLHGNQLTDLPSLHRNVSYTTTYVHVLDLSENRLDELLAETFKYLVNLIILILDKNNITTLQPNYFLNMQSLQILYLDDNQLTTLAPKTFPNHLLQLHLSGNQLSKLPSHIFRAQRAENQLQELTISQNNIISLPRDFFCNTPNLQQLSIADNQLQSLDVSLFANLKQLKFLNISNNQLKSVFLGTSQRNQWNFCNNTYKGSTGHLLPNIQYINLNNNTIQMFEGYLFEEMPIIEALSIRENPLRMVDEKTFALVKNYTIVLVDEPATCCFIEKKSQCKPKNPKPPYLTCLRLLPYPSIRIFMWIFGLFALVGNLSVLLWRCKTHGRENIIQVFLIQNLAASDLMMGVYMLIIASADTYYQQYFPSWSSDWRNGPLCKLAGTLSVLSSEASVFFITLISIDRFLAIKYPRGKWRLTRKSTLIVLMCLWSIALLLSVIPVSFSGLNQDFYDVSEVCIGLPFVRAPVYLSNTFSRELQIDTNFRLSWNSFIVINSSISFINGFSSHYSSNYSIDIEFEETYLDVKEGNNPGLFFSIVLFLGINFVCFLVVAVTYTWIFIIVKQSNKRVGISRTNQEIALAKRMGAIIVTDFMCWAPIIVIGILVQSSIVTIHPVVYVYIVVFLLPINSAVNPYIYTIAIILSDYWSRTKNTKHRKVHAKTNIGLTRTANAENENEHAKKRNDVTNKKTENVLKLVSTTFSQQPKSSESETKSDAENNIGLANNETKNVPKIVSTSFSHQPMSPETDTKSDAENDVNLGTNGRENVRKISSDSFTHQPKSPETDTKSDAEKNIGIANNRTENVPQIVSTSFSHQPMSPKTDTKSDAENDVNLGTNGRENVRKISSDSFSHQPKSPETDTKSDAEVDVDLGNNITEKGPKVSTQFSHQPESPVSDIKSVAEIDVYLGNNETENVSKVASDPFSHQPKSPVTETKSDAEKNIGLGNNGTGNVSKLASTTFSHQPMSLEADTKSEAEIDVDQGNNRTENVSKLAPSPFYHQPESPVSDIKSVAEIDVYLGNNKTENVSKVASDPFSHQPKSPVTETKSDAEKNIGLGNNGTGNVSKLASTTFSRQPMSLEADTKSDAEIDVDQGNNRTENVSKLAPASFSHQSRNPETETENDTKSDAENHTGLGKK